MTSLFNLLQNISVLIEETISKDKSIKLKYSPNEYNMDNNSLFLDIGSGFGKPVLHSALQVGCRSVGVEVVPARVEFCLDFLFENILDKNFFASIDSRENNTDCDDRNDPTVGILNDVNTNDVSLHNPSNDQAQVDDECDLEMKLFNTINLNELPASYYESVINENNNMFIELRVNFNLIYSNEFIDILAENKKTHVPILIEEDEERVKLKYCNYFNSDRLEIEIHTIDDILYSTTSIVLLQMIYSDPDNLEREIINEKLKHMNKLNLQNICRNINNNHLLNFLLFVNSIFLGRKNVLHESHDVYCKHYLKGCPNKGTNSMKKPSSVVTKMNKSKQEGLYKELKEELENREKAYLKQRQVSSRNGSYSPQESKLLQEVLTGLKFSPYERNWGNLITFIKEDATKYEYYHDEDKKHFTHIYAYNKLMSAECREKVASVLNKTNFKVLAWYSNPTQTLNAGLKNFYFISKFPMQSTSTEKFHVYVYIKTK